MLEQKTEHLMNDMGTLLPMIVANALNAVGAIIILLIGFWLSGKADQLVVGAFSRTPHFDPMLRGFFGSLARYLVLTVTVLAVLSEFGIQTTSLVAVIGAAGLAIGLALQGHALQFGRGSHAVDFPTIPDRSQGADRSEYRHGHGVDVVLDRAGNG
jgi:small conductance mechanosensitive channel